MSESDSKLSAPRRDSASGHHYLRRMRIDTAQETRSRGSACAHAFSASRPTLLVAMLSLWSLSAEAQATRPADGRMPSRLESTVDASVVPGDDFFSYANG